MGGGGLQGLEDAEGLLELLGAGEGRDLLDLLVEGIDNDGDGLIDSADPGCTGATDGDEPPPGPPWRKTTGSPAGLPDSSHGNVCTASTASRPRRYGSSGG